MFSRTGIGLGAKPQVDILIVDDREDGLITLEAVLGDDKSYRLVKARSGIEAIALLTEYQFALILLDVQMPHMNGMEAAEIIRRHRGYESVPIIFVTAINQDERYVYRGYEVGAVDYIFKPFDPLILKSKVAVFVDLHRKNQMLIEQAQRLAEAESLERRAHIQSLELESLRRYQSLADSIPHMVLRASVDGRLEYHNQLWSRYTGMAEGEGLGLGWIRALHPDDAPAIIEVWEHSIATGENYEIEGRFRRHDGEFRWHWVKAEAELNEKGEVIAWLGTVTDIHDRRSFEEELREARKTAEAANNAKTHFLANMSHEIRTPLNAVMGFSSLLLDPEMPTSDKARSISIVQRNCQQLLKIVDELLDLSKVEAGEMSVERIEVPVLELVNEIKTVMEAQARKKDIQFSFDIATGVPSKVVTDFTRLRQILLNIIGNALKFTSKGSVKVMTQFVRNDDKAFLEFKIRDTGIGIDAGSAEKIFQPFSQADSSTTRLFGGTGLGLALARRLARALGGDVELSQSEPGTGSSFRVTIEAEVPADASWLTRARELSEPLSPGNEPPVKSDVLRGKRILLVEDAEDNQVLIEYFLSQTGAIVEIAKNGQEGIDKALSANFEAVLMDIQMPLVDGYEATRRLRDSGYTRPIIALTAHALQDEREKCLETGCDGHLTKPINRRVLIESLLRVIN